MTYPVYCLDIFNTILKIMLGFFAAVILHNIISMILVSKDLIGNKKVNIAQSIIRIIIDLCYFALLITSIYYFNNMPQTCSPSATYSTIYFFSFIVITFANLFNYIFRFLMIVVFFPIFVFYFLKDPASFYQHIGIDPDIIDNLPQDTANEEQQGTMCVICSENIELGEKIIVLKCDGRHFFHSECIKMWLKRKMVCPYCRSTQIF